MIRNAPTLVLLGTAGGPLPSPVRSGIAQAVVAGDRVYLVDCGTGVTRQLRRARLLSRLHQVFITHLHSDHVSDLFNLFLLGWPILQRNPPVQVYGPGPAGGMAALPADQAGRRPRTLSHHSPLTPGLVDLINGQLSAHAYDINIRTREVGSRHLSDLVVPHEIRVAKSIGASGPERVAPRMDPMLVCEDDNVRVTAVLVRHPPVFPAFAYRFDTESGSVVISGDTAPCPNLIALASEADVLVHEVYADDALHQWEDHDAVTEAQATEGDLREGHLFRAHTPLSRVGKIAASAGVGQLVLTHFGPFDDRLPDEHWIRGANSDFDGEIIVGHDLATVQIGG